MQQSTNQLPKTREMFKPQFEKLSPEAAQFLLTCIMGEASGHTPPKPEELGLLTNILVKRIKVMQLPIKFSGWGFAAVLAFANNPGQAVALLIDCLDECEGEEITVERLATRIYPMGFYDEISFDFLVDQIHKKQRAKWSYVYAVTN